MTYTNPAGADTATSDPTGVVDGNPPVNVVDPALSGTARDGQTLTLDDGDWTGSPTLVPAYQWQRCDAAGDNCADISGQTGLNYALSGNDVGNTVRVVVTYTNACGNASEPTDPSDVVDAAPPAVTIDPTVIGTAVDGETVTADPGVWSGTAPVDFDYQWLRCDLDGTNCEPIAGATDDEYTLTSEDAGHGIRVEVTATNAARLGHGHLAGRRRERAGAAEHHAADDLRHPRRRLDADRRRRHLERHHAARLRLPVAALRRRRLQLREIAGEIGVELHADHRRRRP